jgi:hypothetical protein
MDPCIPAKYSFKTGVLRERFRNWSATNRGISRTVEDRLAAGVAREFVKGRRSREAIGIRR